MRYTMKYKTAFFRALFVALTGLLPFAQVQANHVEDMCVRSDSGKHLPGQPIYIPITANIGRDVQNGEAFGPWVPYSITWTCVRTAIPAPPNKHAYQPPNDNFEIKTQIFPVNMIDKGNLLADPSFRVYGYAGYNIGVIARVTQEVEGGTSATTNINHLPMGTFFTTNLADGSARKHGDISKFHLKLEVRLVKLPGVKIPTQAQFHPFTINFFSMSEHPDAPRYWKHHSHYYNYVKTTIHNISAACTTPDVDVDLGTAHGGNLVNVNDVGPTTEFNLRFENCPAYMTSVAYRFQSVPLQAISNGTLPLDPVLSTASGVGVQVLNADETPLAFNNTFIPLTAYDAVNPEPVYLVPMKARIIRTTGALQGGDVHAAMNMIVRYQ